MSAPDSDARGDPGPLTGGLSSPACRLIDRRCPLCGSQLVQVTEAGRADRLICPICLASGDYEAVVRDPAQLRRGTPVAARLRFLIDRARFPRSGE